ncbi:MAG: D-alanyl-D-alanine carboxypeptidase [Thermodesulfobacteriota bacterium]|nr:D-alanyl-D-alanine carboxypeptidase [Thermodesulfobacteriota bacterium]
MNQNFGAVLATSQGKILYSKNPDKEFIPASTLKLLTSLGAIYYLGENFSFKTDFFIDDNLNLTIKGYGDPLLTSEAIKQISDKLAYILKQKKNFSIKAIIIDDTFFALSLKIPGRGVSSNPYDAPSGAFCANFNTVSFQYSKKKIYVSGEKETPLLGFTQKRINASGLEHGRITLSKNESRVYAGMLIKYFLNLNGIQVTGKVKNGVAADKKTLILTYRSNYDLNDIIKKLLNYSNNFIANQLLLTIGAKAFTPPGTIEKGVKALTDYSKKNIGTEHTKIAEGSGLSRKNRTTPRDMLKILLKFKEYHLLMKKNGAEYFKTGTLNGIRTRAGYFTDREKNLYPFVIMVNSKGDGYSDIKKKLFNLVKERQ